MSGIIAGETALKPILRTFVNTKDNVWRLTIEKTGTTYVHEVTGSHPYYVIGAGWVDVRDLWTGAEFITEDGHTATLVNIYDTGRVVATYNFELADINTYYVSAAKVLVHNCGGGRGGKQFRGPDPAAEGRPHTRIRTDADGYVTHYETYDFPEPGLGKRVDVVGPAHGGVAAPHVVETRRHVNPGDPSRSRYVESRPRPARQDEIPRRRQ